MNGLNVRRQEKPVLSRLSVLLYGFPKIGKTTQAAKLPGALLLNCEPGGTDFVKNADVVDIHNLAELERTIDLIIKSDYKAVVLDGFTWMVNQAAKIEAARPGANGRQQDGRRVYQQISDRVTAVIGKLLDSGKIVIATGHSRMVDSSDGSADKKDVRPDLNESLADDLFGVFSIICYCYPTQSGSMMLTKPNDNDKRRIFAGDRSGVLPEKMPLDLPKMLAALKATAVDAPVGQTETEKVAA